MNYILEYNKNSIYFVLDCRQIQNQEIDKEYFFKLLRV
jgi:hypothetical protein